MFASVTFELDVHGPDDPTLKFPLRSIPDGDEHSLPNTIFS